MLSAIVPVLNAETSLATCLQRLSNCGEVIVVDGGSTDRTAEIALSCGARLIGAPRGRGTQLQAGAAAATGSWLLIVHADTFLDADWRSAAQRHMEAFPSKAGYFRFRLRSDAAAARKLEKLVELRCRLFGLPYGDQALLLPRTLHDEIGGFAAIPLMEDVDITRRLGRSRLRQINADAWTSADKWQRDGWLSRSARNMICLLLYRLGVSPDRIARLYR
jgi:rSAM/selenodomain-associated transferase 2